jgi:hypothetical protein
MKSVEVSNPANADVFEFHNGAETMPKFPTQSAKCVSIPTQERSTVLNQDEETFFHQ